MSIIIKTPRLMFTLLEVRTPFEIGAQLLSHRFYEKHLPKGEGRPVLVIPGFGASDSWTHKVRQSLRRLGYKPVGWNMGRNMGYTKKNREHLVAELTRLHSSSSGQKVSIVGWSLGGIFARELGRNHPQHVHSVITIGSPFSGDPRGNLTHGLFHRISGKEYTQESEAAFHRRSAPPGIRSIAIHSKSDGVVAWQCSQEQESELTENIEVFSSHFGLVFNPLVLSAIAKALKK